MKKETAFSGLEAAIVLIAFVVVAAVFSYVMLGAGFFATQKSQEVTYSGIKQSTSNLVLDGNIYGSHDNALSVATVGSLTFWLAIPEGGQAQDMGEVKYMYTRTDENGIVSSVVPISSGIRYEATAVGGYSETSQLLSSGSKVKVVITMPSSTQPSSGEKFTLEIKPKVGAATLISKSLASGYVGGEIL